MVRFGIMGAGNIAHYFAKAVADVEGATLTAVASKSAERAEAFAKEENIPHFYGDYEEMLRSGNVDAVYIATTMNYHYENILQCLNAGKHVLCEKCMVLTHKQAEEVFALAKQKGLFVMEAMWVRFLPKTQKVLEWVKSGRIGKLKMAQATLGFRAELDPHSRMYDPALGGGAMYDLGVYLIEVLSFFTENELTEIDPTVLRASTGVDETVNLNLRYGDYLINGQCSIAAKLPENGYLYGEDGYIFIDHLHWGNTVRLYDKDRKLAEEYCQPERNGFTYEVEEAVRCIEQGLLESKVASHKMTLDCCTIFDRCLGTAE